MNNNDIKEGFFTAATIVELETLVEPTTNNRPEIYY